MSLYGVLRTGVSGLSVQASKLGTVADNIANANTTGYKRASIEFSSLVIGDKTDAYNAGGVTSNVRSAVSQQGSLQQTTSSSDLAIEGKGFFVVSDTAGTPFMTRAGSFVPDSEGFLVNAGGYSLMGYPLDDSGLGPVVNGMASLQKVNIRQSQLDATASLEGRFSANLPSNAAVTPAGDLPSTNAATAQPAVKTSLVVYDDLGNEVILSVFFSKTAANEWEAAVYNQSDAAAGGAFPYAAGPLAVTALQFDPTSGELAGASANAITVPVPNGAAVDLDLSLMTQLAADFTVMDAEVDGNPPSAVSDIEFTADGTVVALMENGSRRPIFTIALADVTSPDNLRGVTGNVYMQTNESGDIRVGTPGVGGFGSLIGGALEQSNVDMASELVSMIEAQRGYSANSKVFQTGAELLDVLINLKR
jgi:flagellar hook protein FlgE